MCKKSVWVVILITGVICGFTVLSQTIVKRILQYVLVGIDESSGLMPGDTAQVFPGNMFVNVWVCREEWYPPAYYTAPT